MDYLTAKADKATVDIHLIDKAGCGAWLAARPAGERGWLAEHGFEGEPGQLCRVPGADGRMAYVALGAGQPLGIWDLAAAPGQLAAGRFRIATALSAADAFAAAFGWAAGTYRYDRLQSRPVKSRFATLVWPHAPGRKSAGRKAVTGAIEGIFLARDLINTPANLMGPAELAAAARKLARAHGARIKVIKGDALLAQGWPAVHAVGRASPRAPRLIDITWGDQNAPRVTLVGKGVCFDTGGLDLKSAAGMKLMKKDMGGAANALGLASMVMAAGLGVRLRLLIPAVENSVAGDPIRPLDVIKTRKGLTVEIWNTDAEGRLILADALAEASRDAPACIFDFATLTGAARVALGAEVPALFSNDEALAEGLAAAAARTGDALWRLPLVDAYRDQIKAQAADLNNCPDGGMGGAITAALFLEAFVDDGLPWAHIDLMGWNQKSRPGRPEGGETFAIRAVFDYLTERFGTG